MNAATDIRSQALDKVRTLPVGELQGRKVPGKFHVYVAHTAPDSYEVHSSWRVNESMDRDELHCACRLSGTYHVHAMAPATTPEAAVDLWMQANAKPATFPGAPFRML